MGCKRIYGELGRYESGKLHGGVVDGVTVTDTRPLSGLESLRNRPEDLQSLAGVDSQNSASSAKANKPRDSY